MTLEERLRAAAADAFPPTPDLTGTWAVKATTEVALTAQPWRRRTIALALAALLVPTAAIAAVELLTPDHIRIERTPTLPPLPAPAASDLGRPVSTLGEASSRAGFPVQTPAALGPPEEIRVTDEIVTLVWKDVVLTQVPARQGDEAILVKTVGRGTGVERVSVAGAPGFFLTGAPHAVAYLRPNGEFAALPPRLAGNALAFERDGLVIRIEGTGLTRTRALRLARATAPPPSPSPAAPGSR
jgi:hypothetical protein